MSIFEEFQLFIFSNVIMFKGFIYFCNVVKMAIIYKNKLTKFGYEQVVELETCLNPSILWLPSIIYCKKLMIYIYLNW
jgi:hypothetical protein